MTKFQTNSMILLPCIVLLCAFMQPAFAGNSLLSALGSIPGNGGTNPANTSGAGAVSPNDQGSTSLNSMADEYVFQHPEVDWLKMDVRDQQNNPIPGFVNPATIAGAGPFGTMYPPTPAVAMGWKTESKLTESMYNAGIKQLGGFNGQVNSDLKSYAQELQAGDFMARTLQYPPNVANQARAQALGQAQTMGNAMGEIAKAQSESAIAYCAGFMKNFTVEESNKWNRIRNGLFIPIAILLLLPGAILTQVKAMASAGNPVLSDRETNPFEGILRSVVAIFLIPATYLVVNYGIDFSNSIIDSIAGTYHSVIGGNMYQDAFSSEIRAFPVRTPRENQGGGVPKQWPQTPIKGVSDFENDYITNKIVDPSTNYYDPMNGKTDEAMPAGAVAARELSFGANAALTAGWNVLCAFQIAYLSYLFFVGPVVAALWVWPMRQFREALPNWVEGVITLCFWSLFWNTAILLMACFKGVDDSGTVITSALNFLATSSVKFAFDFAGLVRAAGQEAGKKAAEKGGKASSSQPAADPGKSGDRGARGIGVDGKGGSDGASGGSQKPGAGTNTQSQTLANISASPSLRKNDFAPVKSVPPPPISPSSHQNLSPLQSQSVRLGNYTITRGLDDKGKPVDLLKSGNGHVIAQLPKGMVDGQTFSSNGVTLKYNNNNQGCSYTLTDGSGKPYTAKISTLQTSSSSPLTVGPLDSRANASKNSIALASLNGNMLLENGGNTLLMQRAGGKGFDSFNLDPGATSGSFNLPNGHSLSLINHPDGSHKVSLTGDGQNETFSVRPNLTGFEVGHTVNGALDRSTKISTDGNSTIYSNYDAGGRLTDIDKVTGNNTLSTLYDPEKGSILGYVNSNHKDDGSSTTDYYSPDNKLTASAEHSVKADGGFVDTLKDAAGQKVSVQEKTPDNCGGYSMQTSKYKDGKVLASVLSTFDANDKLVKTMVPPPPTTGGSPNLVDPKTDILTDTRTMAADIVRGTQSGNVDYVQRMADATGMSQSDLLMTAQQATAGDPYAQTKLMASYASHSGDQKFVNALAASGNMTVADVQSIAPQAASGNISAQTKLMSACAAQMGDNSYFNQIAAATNMPVADVQQLTREAASGDVFAQTRLTAAHALQSGDSNFFSQIADATKMSAPDVQTLAREATAGNIYAQTQLTAANVMKNPDANFVQQIADSSKHSVPYAESLTQRAAQGDVYAGTQLMAAAVAQFANSSFAGQMATATNLPTSGVQSLTREAACGDIPAQTRLLSAYASQSSDPELLGEISANTQLSKPQAQALTRDAASGNPSSETRVMSAFASNSSELVHQIASATSMPAPLIENLTRQAAHGNVYAETRLASSFSSSSHSRDNSVSSASDPSTYACDQSFITGAVRNESHQVVSAAAYASHAVDASTSVYASIAPAASTSIYASSAAAASTSSYASPAAAALTNNYATAAASMSTNNYATAAASMSTNNYATAAASMSTNNYAAASGSPSTTKDACAATASTNNYASTGAGVSTINSATAGGAASANNYASAATAPTTNYSSPVVAASVNHASSIAAYATTNYASAAPAASTINHAAAGAAAAANNYASRAADASTMTYASLPADASTTTNASRGPAVSTNADDEIYFGATDSCATGNSLEKQLIDAGTANQSFQRGKTIGEVLKGATPSASQLEALTNAHINYTTLCSLLNRGLKYQAQQLVNVIDRDIEMLSHNAQALPLIESYIELLSRHQLIDQADAFQNHLHSANALNSASNLW